mmetsp:Transcript_29640/g.80124  ORF Transcript_29640/g.80124 Transcript_29640/m.80124 type:complete len:104 (-) Transcript_29640:698-1009(-)
MVVRAVPPKQALAEGGGGSATGAGAMGGGTAGAAVTSKPKGEVGWHGKPCSGPPKVRQLPGMGGTASKFGQLLGAAPEPSQHAASKLGQPLGAAAEASQQLAS